MVWSPAALIRWTRFHGTETYRNMPILILKPDIAYRGRVKQTCHADAGLCDGGHLWLRHTWPRPSQYKNPTLHIGVG